MCPFCLQCVGWDLLLLVRGPVLAGDPGLAVGAGAGSGAEPGGHVVQGGLQGLHVLHQLQGELLGALLQPPPACTIGQTNKLETETYFRSS